VSIAQEKISEETHNEMAKLLKFTKTLKDDRELVYETLLGLSSAVSELEDMGLPDTVLAPMSQASTLVHGYVEGLCIALDTEGA
jgi:hypothetical protein